LLKKKAREDELKRMLEEKEELIDEYLKNPFTKESAEISDLKSYCQLLMPKSEQEEAKVEEVKEEENVGGDDNQFQNDNVAVVVNKRAREEDTSWTGMAQGGRGKRGRGRKRNRQNQVQRQQEAEEVLANHLQHSSEMLDLFAKLNVRAPAFRE